MPAYNTVCLIWKTEHEAIPVPILGWFEDEAAAQLNAARVLAVVAPPEMASLPVTITPIPLSSEAVEEFIRNRPKVKRGRK